MLEERNKKGESQFSAWRHSLSQKVGELMLQPLCVQFADVLQTTCAPHVYYQLLGTGSPENLIFVGIFI